MMRETKVHFLHKCKSIFTNSNISFIKITPAGAGELLAEVTSSPNKYWKEDRKIEITSSYFFTTKPTLQLNKICLLFSHSSCRFVEIPAYSLYVPIPIYNINIFLYIPYIYNHNKINFPLFQLWAYQFLLKYFIFYNPLHFEGLYLNNIGLNLYVLDWCTLVTPLQSTNRKRLGFRDNFSTTNVCN